MITILFKVSSNILLKSVCSKVALVDMVDVIRELTLSCSTFFLDRSYHLLLFAAMSSFLFDFTSSSECVYLVVFPLGRFSMDSVHLRL